MIRLRLFAIDGIVLLFLKLVIVIIHLGSLNCPVFVVCFLLTTVKVFIKNKESADQRIYWNSLAFRACLKSCQKHWFFRFNVSCCKSFLVFLFCCCLKSQSVRLCLKLYFFSCNLTLTRPDIGQSVLWQSLTMHSVCFDCSAGSKWITPFPFLQSASRLMEFIHWWS